MSLIEGLRELKRQCDGMEQKAHRQQSVYFKLINGIVKMHQDNRVAKNYRVSDELRDLLQSVGVTITQGTAGYAHEQIPPSLKGRPIGDTWELQG